MLKVACYNCVSRFLVALDGKSRNAYRLEDTDIVLVGEKNGLGPDAKH